MGIQTFIFLLLSDVLPSLVYLSSSYLYPLPEVYFWFMHYSYVYYSLHLPVGENKSFFFLELFPWRSFARIVPLCAPPRFGLFLFLYRINCILRQYPIVKSIFLYQRYFHHFCQQRYMLVSQQCQIHTHSL